MIVSAGQIQVGGVNGLTKKWRKRCRNCTGAGPSTCNDQNNYDDVLFSGLSNGADAAAAVLDLPGTTTANVGTITDTSANAKGADGPGGVTFAMINDGTNPSGCLASCQESNNYWSLGGYSSNQTIKVLVGAYGVTDVWTMKSTPFLPPRKRPAIDRSTCTRLQTASTATGAGYRCGCSSNL